MDSIPRVFNTGKTEGPSRFTDLIVLTGPETAFPPSAVPRHIGEVKDGPDNTLAIVEVANSRISWTRPQDIDLDEFLKGKGPAISAPTRRSPYVAFMDGQVFQLNASSTLQDIQSLATISGGESMTRERATVEKKITLTVSPPLSKPDS